MNYSLIIVTFFVYQKVRDRLRYALEANAKLEEKLESTMQEVLHFFYLYIIIYVQDKYILYCDLFIPKGILLL